MSDLIDRVEAANAEAVRLLSAADPVLVDVRPAAEVIPALGGPERRLLHAGPPIGWERMCGPVRGAVIGAILYEGWAGDAPEAERLAASGAIAFDPCHHHAAVGPMAGLLSPSMWVYCVENREQGNRAFCSLNEGLGKVLRFGAYGDDVRHRLRWLADTVGPALAAALRGGGPLPLKPLIAQALTMGDEGHNRNVAGTALFFEEMAPRLLDADLPRAAVREILAFFKGNPHTFLNLTMPAGKAAADAIRGLADSTIVYGMARNGVEFGIRVAGCGERWFTAPAGQPRGLYFAGFSEADGNRDLGDSTITETAGFGAAAMAGAPAIVKFVGGRPQDALAFSQRMYEITFGRHDTYQIPALGFRGTPLGIDVRKVVDTGLTPAINTGIAHREPGIGQIGAGILDAPLEPFAEALAAFVEGHGGDPRA